MSQFIQMFYDSSPDDLKIFLGIRSRFSDNLFQKIRVPTFIYILYIIIKAKHFQMYKKTCFKSNMCLEFKSCLVTNKLLSNLYSANHV